MADDVVLLRKLVGKEMVGERIGCEVSEEALADVASFTGMRLGKAHGAQHVSSIP